MSDETCFEIKKEEQDTQLPNINKIKFLQKTNSNKNADKKFVRRVAESREKNLSNEPNNIIKGKLSHSTNLLTSIKKESNKNEGKIIVYI
jgi:hypothetical protein